MARDELINLASLRLLQTLDVCARRHHLLAQKALAIGAILAKFVRVRTAHTSTRKRCQWLWLLRGGLSQEVTACCGTCARMMSSRAYVLWLTNDCVLENHHMVVMSHVYFRLYVLRIHVGGNWHSTCRIRRACLYTKSCYNLMNIVVGARAGFSYAPPFRPANAI